MAPIMAVIFIGTILCHRVNRIGDNTDFIARMICLGWPVGFKLAATFSATLALCVILSALGIQSFLSAIQDQEGFLSRLLAIGFIIGYYDMLYGKFAAVAQAKEAGEALKKGAGRSLRRIALAVSGGIGFVVAVLLFYAWIESIAGHGMVAELIAYCFQLSLFLPFYGPRWVRLARI